MDEFKNDLTAAYKTGTKNTDIQNKLYSWFEKKGLVNKIRAHIREQMISALKDGPTWSPNKSNVTSPKIQAINLLVADFLMNQENLLTLSVFITEVPLLGNLQEFSSYVNCVSNSIQSIPVTKPSFHLNDVQDILEALGIQANSDVTELTCQYYFNDNHLVHSLLACLFKALTTIKNNLNKYNEIQKNKNDFINSSRIENNTYERRLSNWLVNVEDTLSSFNLNEVQKNTLKNLFKNYHQNNNSQETAVYKEQLKHLEKINKEMVEKVADLEQMLATHFHSHEQKQIENVKEELRLEQQQLYQLINVFEEKEKSMQEKLDKSEKEYNKKIQDLKNQKYELRIKEMEILRHEKMLKEEPLKCVNETRIIEFNQVKLLQEQNGVLAKQLQEIQSKLNKLEEHKKIEKISNRIDNDFQRIETSLDRELVRKLQRENDELRKFIKVQRERIEELSIKASNLTRQIEKTHYVSPSITNYQTRNVKKKLNFFNYSSNTKGCSNQNISSTTTDHSTTLLDSDNLTEDDIILDARSRLKILEMNSAKVEQKLKNFKKNHMGFSNYKKIQVNNNNRKSYNEIRFNLSDDSDIPTLKNTSNKINLKDLANKIGYHRSIRRSINHSTSENDTNPKISHNTNITNVSPIKKYTGNILSSNVHKTMYQELPINKPSSKIKSPINKMNHCTELSINRPNITSTESTNENHVEIELAVKDNKLLINTNSPDKNNLENPNQIKSTDNTKMRHNINLTKTSNNNKKLDENYDVENHVTNSQSFNGIELIDLPQKSITIQQNGSNKIDASSTSSKNEKDSDHSISFGSNKTESYNFWAL